MNKKGETKLFTCSTTKEKRHFELHMNAFFYRTEIDEYVYT